jgi:hypothetical protein
MHKKYLFLILFFSFSIQAYSQTYRLKGGVNLSKVFFRNETGNVSDVLNFSMPGFQLGATLENSIFNNLALEYGLLVTLKGFKIDELQDNLTILNKTYLYYLDLPLAFKLNLDWNTKSNWYIATGPLFSFGMGGNYTTIYDRTGSKEVEDGKVEWGDESGQLKRFDFGVLFGTGVEFDRWQVGLSYNLGMINISNVYENTLKNRQWQISVGYEIGKAK